MADPLEEGSSDPFIKVCNETRGMYPRLRADMVTKESILLALQVMEVNKIVGHISSHTVDTELTRWRHLSSFIYCLGF